MMTLQHTWFAFCILGAFLTPFVVSAKVYITEVAWMGGVENANAEWIELYNDGDSEVVDGWTLTAKDEQPEILLEGVLPARGYALLERTSDDTVPGETAFQVYAGALGNSGETLELRDATGALIDRVYGGEDWELGGDNETKETLQRLGEPALGAWGTAEPSPMRGSVVFREEAPESDASTKTNKVLTQTDTQTKKETVVRRDPALTLDIGEDRVVTVGIPTTFGGHTYRESGREIMAQDVVWNFGDGSTAKGRKVEHAFAYVGEYVVTARATWDAFRESLTAEDRLVVRVVDPTYTIVSANEEYIEIENTGDDEVDLSGYALALGEDHFRVPQGTIVLPRTRVRFPATITQLTVYPNMVAGIFTPDNVLTGLFHAPGATFVAQGVVGEKARDVAPVVRTTYTASQTVPVSRADSEVAPVEEDTGTVATAFVFPELLASAETFADSPIQGSANPEQSPLWWWLIGLCSLIGVAVALVLLIRHEQEEIIKGYVVEEEG